MKAVLKESHTFFSTHPTLFPVSIKGFGLFLLFLKSNAVHARVEVYLPMRMDMEFRCLANRQLKGGGSTLSGHLPLFYRLGGLLSIGDKTNRDISIIGGYGFQCVYACSCSMQRS